MGLVHRVGADDTRSLPMRTSFAITSPTPPGSHEALRFAYTFVLTLPTASPLPFILAFPLPVLLLSVAVVASYRAISR
jgi:hypothetical protein